MLAKNNRFSGSREIRLLYKNGQAVRARFLALRFRKLPSEDWRVSIVVSKKVHKSAVVRNRIRRRLYEILRTAHPETMRGAEYLITVYDDSLATMPSDQLRHEVVALITRKKQGRSQQGRVRPAPSSEHGHSHGSK